MPWGFRQADTLAQMAIDQNHTGHFDMCRALGRFSTVGIVESWNFRGVNIFVYFKILQISRLLQMFPFNQSSDQKVLFFFSYTSGAGHDRLVSWFFNRWGTSPGTHMQYGYFQQQDDSGGALILTSTTSTSKKLYFTFFFEYTYWRYLIWVYLLEVLTT